MDDKIKELERILEIWRSNYEDALQWEDESGIAYMEGYIDGLTRAIKILEGKEEE